MMLPMRISVSLAPVSYFFCAAAGAARASAAQAISRCFQNRMVSSTLTALHQFASDQTREPGGPTWHQIDDDEQDDAIHGAGEALRHGLRDIRNEQDEQSADHRAGNRRDAADHEPDEQSDREHEGE